MCRIILVNEVSSFSIVRGYPNKYHKYHILSPSIWPFVAALGIMLMVFGFVFWFYTGFILTLLFGIVELILIVFFWWQDVSYESGEHTNEIMLGLKFGMALFIVSEVMFFFSFFWAFFQVSLVPGHEIGGVWPPVGLEELVIDPWSVPLLNTFLLLSSGVTVTCAHHAFLFFFSVERASAGISFSNASLSFLFESFKTAVSSLQEFLVRIILLKKNGIEKLYVGIELLVLTIILALIFTLLQCYEYVESLIRISDSVYGSTFFVMTGFHGFHVIIGSTFLIVCLIRIILNQFYIKDSVGLECSIWYWHFVDVVWLFLFVSLYMWGNDASIMVDWIQFENIQTGPHEIKGLYSTETSGSDIKDSGAEKAQNLVEGENAGITGIIYKNYMFLKDIIYTIFGFFDSTTGEIDSANKRKSILPTAEELMRVNKPMKQFEEIYEIAKHKEEYDKRYQENKNVLYKIYKQMVIDPINFCLNKGEWAAANKAVEAVEAASAAKVGANMEASEASLKATLINSASFQAFASEQRITNSSFVFTSPIDMNVKIAHQLLPHLEEIKIKRNLNVLNPEQRNELMSFVVSALQSFEISDKLQGRIVNKGAHANFIITEIDEYYTRKAQGIIDNYQSNNKCKCPGDIMYSELQTTRLDNIMKSWEEDGRNLNSDFASPYQLGFQDSASLLMDGIIELHNKIMVYLFFIFLVVMWVLIACLEDVVDNSLKEYSWVLESVVYPFLQSSKLEYKKIAAIFIVVFDKIKVLNFKRIFKK